MIHSYTERIFTMNKLNKLTSFSGVKGPVLTIVMDGVGLAPDTAGNAVSLAYTPTLDRIMKEYPMVTLKAHGTAVGLPSDDDMGNSEVGHNALGAGQVFAQGAKLVTQSIESGKMFASDTWQTLIGGVKTNNSTLHFLGLFSDGNVHSHIDHLKAMLVQAKKEGIEAVTSVGPMDAKRILELNELTSNVSSGKIFVTAFLDFKTFKKFSESLAWETEVWIADMPDHMIHLNGDRFMGPR